MLLHKFQILAYIVQYVDTASTKASIMLHHTVQSSRASIQLNLTEYKNKHNAVLYIFQGLAYNLKFDKKKKKN